VNLRASRYSAPKELLGPAEPVGRKKTTRVDNAPASEASQMGGFADLKIRQASELQNKKNEEKIYIKRAMTADARGTGKSPVLSKNRKVKNGSSDIQEKDPGKHFLLHSKNGVISEKEAFGQEARCHPYICAGLRRASLKLQQKFSHV